MSWSFGKANMERPYAGRQRSICLFPSNTRKVRQRLWDGDRPQLCAQAICLEEMFSCAIDCAYLYYGETRKREEVPLTPALRENVHAFFMRMHAATTGSIPQK